MRTQLFPVQIFDLDGTLVDSLPGIDYSFRVALEKVLPSLDWPNIRPFIGPPIRDIFNLALNGIPTVKELDALETAFRRSYDTDGWLLTVPYPDAVAGITSLTNSGVMCYVVTNKPALPTQRILERLGIFHLFCEVVTRESRTPHFPTKLEATRDLATRLNAKPTQTLFVGDSADDAESARACGFRFAAADYGFGGVSVKKPDHIDFHLPDFAALLALTIEV